MSAGTDDGYTIRYATEEGMAFRLIFRLIPLTHRRRPHNPSTNKRARLLRTRPPRSPRHRINPPFHALLPLQPNQRLRQDLAHHAQ